MVITRKNTGDGQIVRIRQSVNSFGLCFLRALRCLGVCYLGRRHCETVVRVFVFVFVFAVVGTSECDCECVCWRVSRTNVHETPTTVTDVIRRRVKLNINRGRSELDTYLLNVQSITMCSHYIENGAFLTCDYL